MPLTARLLAAAVSLSLAVTPATAAMRVRVRVVPAAPAAPAVNGAIGAQPRNLSLPQTTLNTLPGLGLPQATIQQPRARAQAAAPQVQAAAASAQSRPRAVAAQAAPSAQAAPVRKAFTKKVAAVAQAVAQAAKPIHTPNAQFGRADADKVFAAISGEGEIDPNAGDFERLLEDNLRKWERGELNHGGVDARQVLADDAPKISERRLLQIARANRAVEEAVQQAMDEVLPEAAARVLARGSSARGTQADDHPDYDVNVDMPKAWSDAELQAFAAEKLSPLRQALAKHLKEAARQAFADGKARVDVGAAIQLSDPATRRQDAGVYMLPVKVYGASGELLLDVDVTFTNRDKYTNPYPEYFAEQMRQVEQLGGQAAKEDVLFGIRLAKKFFKEVVEAYKVWRGGPSGVGVEQLIMQSGEAAGDKGRTIKTPGNFDSFADKIYDAAFTEDGYLRPIKEARKRWQVHNPYREPANFLTHISERAFTRLANAIGAYRRARAAGRPISFDELKNARGRRRPAAPKTRAEARPLPLRKTTAVRVGINSKSGNKRLRGKLARARAKVDYPLLGFSLSRPLKGHADQYTLTAVVEGEVAPDRLAGEIAQLLQSEGLSAQAKGAAPGNGRLQFFVRMHGRRSDARAEQLTRKLLKRFARRMQRFGRMRRATTPSKGGEFLVAVDLENGADATKAAEEAEAFFKAAGTGAALTGVALPQAARPEVQAAAAMPLGRLTLEMLERFTLHGPKPAERGKAYLYAQGAKPVAAELEAATRARMVGGGVDGRHGEVVRTLLQRRGSRSFVLMPRMNQEGEIKYRPVAVPWQMAQGIVSETLVEAEFVGDEVAGVTLIGAYPGDMVIGKVARQGNKLVLESLMGYPKALYGRMPLAGEVKEGDIVQAFVTPSGDGYAARTLLNLGTEVTPEIAAREIALRHGARGYFDRDVIAQAEEIGRTQDVDAEFEALVAHMKEHAPHLKYEDMTGGDMITVDPIGAGDLDDAFRVIKHEDGGYTWYLATADVAQYVPPRSPAFRFAARGGNTFYSIDKNGVSEYPMNHPVVSKNVSSLLDGKNSLAMVTKMRFAADGAFLEDESDVFLAKVRVNGRYTYEQVTALWKGEDGHGIAHAEQIALARELAGKLNQEDLARGKLALQFAEVAHRETEDGWTTEVVEEDPLLEESHKLIEELKVYGNRGIAALLSRISRESGVPHISRVHPEQDEAINNRLKKQLRAIGVPWRDGVTLWDFLNELNAREDLTPEGRETAQILALMTRRRAEYATSDEEGHEGLALAAGQYDHPSTPIRRFADMYNRALLEAYISGRDPRAVYAAVVEDITEMGFSSLDEYMKHLNGREAAAKAMDREVDNFMSLYELAKPKHKGKTYSTYVKAARGGRFPMAVLQFRDIPVSVVLTGDKAKGLEVLDEVRVSVRGADPARAVADISFEKGEPLPAFQGQTRQRRSGGGQAHQGRGGPKKGPSHKPKKRRGR